MEDFLNVDGVSFSHGARILVLLSEIVIEFLHA